MLCHQCFVGGHHAFSGHQALLHKSICGFDPAHYLYYDLNGRIFCDHLKIMYDFFLNRISREISQIQNVFYMDLIPGSLIDSFLIGL